MGGMLGQLKRTTRLDVGLAMGFAGGAYLVWAVVAGVARGLVQRMSWISADMGSGEPGASRVVRILFADAGIVIDLVGLAWLLASLVLVLLSSRQRVSVSWSWLSACSQAFVAALGGIWVAWSVYLPFRSFHDATHKEATSPFVQVSELSLPVIVALAILIWVTCLIWLLVERARLNRHGPTLTDGLRTHTYR